MKTGRATIPSPASDQSAIGRISTLDLFPDLATAFAVTPLACLAVHPHDWSDSVRAEQVRQRLQMSNGLPGFPSTGARRRD